MRIENKSVIISGASSGIGRAVALQLSKFSNRLWLVGRNQEALEEVAELVRKNGSVCEWSVTDVQDPVAVEESFQLFKEKFHSCDMLFLSAGFAELTNVEKLNFQFARAMMETNYFGCLHWIMAALPEMQNRNQGIIAAVSALASYRGLPQGAFYGASKAALSNCLESLRIDLQRQGVQVSTILPAFVDTPMARKFDYAMPNVWSAEKAAKYIVKQIEKGKGEIAFPWSLQFLMKCVRALPEFIFDPLFTKISAEAHKKGNSLTR